MCALPDRPPPPPLTVAVAPRPMTCTRSYASALVGQISSLVDVGRGWMRVRGWWGVRAGAARGRGARLFFVPFRRARAHAPSSPPKRTRTAGAEGPWLVSRGEGHSRKDNTGRRPRWRWWGPARPQQVGCGRARGEQRIVSSFFGQGPELASQMSAAGSLSHQNKTKQKKHAQCRPPRPPRPRPARARPRTPWT